MKKLARSYGAVAQSFLKYWRGYGGTSAVLTSPFFHAAVVLSFFAILDPVNGVWVERSQSITPSMLGFTLGGYAIFVSFGDDAFKRAIAGTKNGEESPLSKFNNTFFHYIFVQSMALTSSLFSESALRIRNPLITNDPRPILEWLVGVSAFLVSSVTIVLFFYSVFLSIAAAMAIRDLVSAYDAGHSDGRQS